MATDPFAAVSAVDPELADVLARELVRQNTTIQLIASENFTSPAVMAAQGTVLTNKYSEGYPGKRYYGGNYVVDDAEELARRRVCALFGADHANVQPHAGAPGRGDPLPGAVRQGHRQGRLPRHAGGPADARDRGQGGVLPRGGPAELRRLRRRHRPQRPGPGRRPGRRGLPDRLRRHRQ